MYSVCTSIHAHTHIHLFAYALLCKRESSKQFIDINCFQWKK